MGPNRALSDWLATDGGTGPPAASRIVLDAFVASHHAHRLRSFFHGTNVHYADSFAESDWAFPGQFLWEHGLRPGAFVATGDPHATEVGAFGVKALHHTPAPLLALSRRRHATLGAARAILLHVNDALPRGRDAVDLAFEAMRQTAPDGLVGSALEVGGPGYDRLTMPERRRLLAALGDAGCQTVLAARPSESRHDELLILNAPETPPLVRAPGTTVPQPISSPHPIDHVVLGGCIGGDLDSLEAYVAALEARRPEPTVRVFLVPASERVLEAAITAGLRHRAEALGAWLLSPRDLPPFGTGTIAVSSCVSAAGFHASPATAIESAHHAALTAPTEALA